MADILTPKQVENEFGFSRASLLRWEESGKLKGIIRTPGGQRRYTRSGLENITKAATGRTSGPYGELGSTGLPRFGGSVYTEELRQLQGASGRKIFREMRLNDPVIGAVLFAVSHSMKMAEWRVSAASESAADKEAVEFVETCLDDMSFTWSETLTFAIDGMIEQGVSLLEIVYKKRVGQAGTNSPGSNYDDGRIGWRKMSPRPVESLTPGDEWVFDENGGLQGINQTDSYINRQVYIPIEKLLMFRSTVYPYNTPEPPPIHRAAYMPYWYTQNLQEIEGIGIERDLNGIPVIYLGQDCSMEGVNSDYQKAMDLVVNIRQDEQAGVVIPKAKMGTGAAEGEGMLLELLSTTSTRAHDTSAIIERYDKRKALVVLAQFVMLGMDKVGSFALSQSQGDLFVMAVTAWLNGIAEVFNRFAVPRLFKLNNFPGITGYPKLVPSTVGVPNLIEIADFVNKLVDKQVLTPDDELERHLRQVAKLPEMTNEGQPRGMQALPPQPQSTPEIDNTQEEGEDEGENLEKAETNVKLTPEGQKALALTVGLEDKIRVEWRKLTSNISGGMAIPAALALYRRRADRLLDEAFDEAWLVGRGGEFDQVETKQIDEALAEQREYLDEFMNELGRNLEIAQNKEERGGILLANLSRAVMYAGAAWTLYNAAKIFNRPADELWKWEGPNDNMTCPDCQEEMRAGERPLSQMKRLPGEVQCLTNCRHELVRVK